MATWLRAALEPGFVEHQLEGPTEPATAWRIASPEPEATLRRVLLATLASEPGPSPSQALALGAGLAGVVVPRRRTHLRRLRVPEGVSVTEGIGDVASVTALHGPMREIVSRGRSRSMREKEEAASTA